MPRPCAYLTMDRIGDFVSDAELSFAPMAELGWEVDMVSWREPCADWDRYELVYICTPWDYQNDVAAFLDVLQAIEQSRAVLVNSLELVRWNLEKTYLRELESRGAAIVPSRFHDTFTADRVDTWFADHGVDTIVVKPVVGANSDGIVVLTQPAGDAVLAELARNYASRPFFVQPFIDSVRREGEYSLFFFGGRYSHGILKKPRAGDFRSQEEHGAEILALAAPDALIRTAHDVIAMLGPAPVYARADFVHVGGRYLLMELELIEPSLYFRTDPASAERFATALTAAAA